MVSLQVQFKTFLCMLLFGQFLAFVFDFYRVVRSFGYLGDISTKIIDFSLCSLAGMMTFVILLKSNSGQVRFYIFMSLGLGIFIYNLLFSKFIIKCLRLILEKIIKIVKKCLKFIKKFYKLTKGVFNKLS